MVQRNTDAVSPVVGVMLMLVVTIIIAAIVSAFAGGIGASTTKAPNVQITAHYSQSQGMWFENNGPDDISTVSTNVYVRCTDSFGTAEHMAWAVNRSSISNSTSTGYNDKYVWLTTGGMTGGIKTFGAGDRAYINPPYQTRDFLQPGASDTYSFNNSANLGKSLWLELSDKSGRTFAKTKVKIEV